MRRIRESELWYYGEARRPLMTNKRLGSLTELHLNIYLFVFTTWTGTDPGTIRYISFN
jgi:hypothetical protein